MRPLALVALLAALASAPLRAENDAPAPGPAKDLTAAACGGGLLVQPADTGKPGDADFDAATDDAVSEVSESADSTDETGKKKPAKKAAPKKKPRTRLIRPRTEKDKAACPGKFKEFYEKYGDRLTAVPAPENVPTEQIEANIDRVFGLAAGPGKKQSLAALKDGDLAAKSAFVAKLFDGVKTLDAGAFETVTKRSHDIAAAKSEGVMNGDLGAGAAPDAAAAAKAAKAAESAREPLDPKADGSPMSALQRQRFTAPSSPPDLGDGGYRPPPVGTYVPAGPPAESSYNRYVPNFIQDAATGAGSWLADKVYGGGNPAVNVEMPADTQSPERWRRVRFGNYGTDAMIKGLVAVGADMGKMNAPTLQIGDISQKGGGTFRRHLSHKVGKDVDVFFITDKHGHFDVPWNLTLAATAVKDMNVTHIFVDTPLKNYMTQYYNAHPEIPAAEREHMAKALSRMSYWPGHDTHFHIRIDY